MGITLREASEKVGVTRQTLMKAIKTGRVSAEKSDNGEWRIEPVELFRVWPPVHGVQQPLQPNITDSDTPGLQAENRDRKRVVEGQSGYVRVELGGGRALKKKTRNQNTSQHQHN